MTIRVYLAYVLDLKHMIRSPVNDIPNCLSLGSGIVYLTFHCPFIAWELDFAHILHTHHSRCKHRAHMG